MHIEWKTCVFCPVPLDLCFTSDYLSANMKIRIPNQLKGIYGCRHPEKNK